MRDDFPCRTTRSTGTELQTSPENLGHTNALLPAALNHRAERLVIRVSRG